MANKLILLLILAIAQTVLAARIEGIITLVDNKKSLRIEGHKLPYTMTSDSQGLIENLMYLNQGDFVSGEGKFDILNQSVKIVGIKFVGLNELLGNWKSQNDEKFYFQDYQTLQYHAPIRKLSTDAQNFRTIRYHITPNSNNKSWPILFTDNFANGSGRVVVSGKKAYITLFNTEGKKMREISLYKQ